MIALDVRQLYHGKDIYGKYHKVICVEHRCSLDNRLKAIEKIYENFSSIYFSHSTPLTYTPLSLDLSLLTTLGFNSPNFRLLSISLKSDR